MTDRTQKPPHLEPKQLSDYISVVGEQVIDDLIALAKPLRDFRFQHINSTRVGGGVAEILAWLVPLFRDLGIHTTWDVMEAPPSFFKVTKSIHNALQGHTEERFTPEDNHLYLQVNAEAARNQVKPTGDVVVIHDPQPAAIPQFWDTNPRRLIWRCHIDASSPSPSVWQFLRPHLDRYHATVFSAAKFSQTLPRPQYTIAPSIDPLSPKNRELEEEQITAILASFGIDRSRPILVQISRFDRFKDPSGVIKAYRLVKQSIDCQLVLAGGGATDDPEGAQVLAEVEEAANGDPDCFVLNLPPFSDLEINALQRGADVVLQKSLREGFGLTVSEGLWKGRPVVAGAAGGIPMQIMDGVNGYLVYTVEGAAFRLRHLLGHADMAKRMGAIGREFVRSHFLLTRHLRDYLALLHLVSTGSRAVEF